MMPTARVFFSVLAHRRESPRGTHLHNRSREVIFFVMRRAEDTAWTTYLSLLTLLWITSEKDHGAWDSLHSESECTDTI